MKQQTAVEWLAEKLSITFQTMYAEEIEQAKAMEKEQLEEAKEEGYDFATTEAIKEIHKNYKLKL